MNWVDYTIIAVILISVVISLFRGLLKEIMGLAVWAVAFWIGFRFADEGADWFVGMVELPSARLALAFGLLFISALIVGGLLNFLLGKLIESTGLTGTDRFLGMFFGLGRALVLVTALVLLAGLTPLPQDPWWRESRLLPGFQTLAEWAAGYMPDDVRHYFEYRPVLDGASEKAPASDPAALEL